MDTNLVILTGRCGKEPEVRFTSGGKAVARFSMATEERWKQGDEWQKKVNWHNVVVWGKTAEAVGMTLSKGSPVYVKGKIETRDYEKDGVKKYVTEVVADQVLAMVQPPKDGERTVEKTDSEFF